MSSLSFFLIPGHRRPSGILLVCIVGLVFNLKLSEGFNDEDGILKWNPSWLSYKNPAWTKVNSRDALYKRDDLSASVEGDYGYARGGGDGLSRRGFYKWSPPKSFVFLPSVDDSSPQNFQAVRQRPYFGKRSVQNYHDHDYEQQQPESSAEFKKRAPETEPETEMKKHHSI